MAPPFPSPRAVRLAPGMRCAHRLSERLFFETFGIDKDVVDEHAGKIEHSLSPEATEKICTFLHHPQTAPTARPFPAAIAVHQSLPPSPTSPLIGLIFARSER